MDREQAARQNHRGSYNCAQSVYAAYADLLGLAPGDALRQAPRPRSEGGKCGAFLAGRAILQRLKPEAIPAYEQAFTAANGKPECARLVMAHGRLNKSCNDYVGDAARLVTRALAE